MARKNSRSFHPIEVDIPTLSGGVGRSTPSKRLPQEAENLDNIIVSLEHSAEKRRGVKLVKWDSSVTDVIDGRLKDISETLTTEGATAAEKDLWFHWFKVSETSKYIIAVNYKAATTDDLWWVFRIDGEGELHTQTVTQPAADDEMRTYITHGNDTSTAEETLRAVAVGSSVLILNTKVKAGFTSDSSSEYNLYEVDGSAASATGDTKGKEVDYITSITVDPKGSAEYWTEWSSFISGETTIDSDDKLDADGGEIYPADPATDGADYNALRYGIWEVKDEVAITIGPDVSSVPQRRPSHGIVKGAINIKLTFGVPIAFMDRTGFTGGSESKKAVDEITFSKSSGVAIPSDQLFSAPDATFITELDGHGFHVPHYPKVNITGPLLESTAGIQIGNDGPNSYRTVIVSFDDSIATGINKIYKRDGTDDEWEEGDDVDAYIAANTNASGYAGIEVVIGCATAASYKELFDQVAAGVNKMFELGICHCSAESNSRADGVTLTNEYYSEQWQRAIVPEEEWDEELNDIGYADALLQPLAPDNLWAYFSDFIKVQDYYYPNPSNKYLGQAVARLSDLRFPPSLADLGAFNGGEEVEQMLKELYPDNGHTEVVDEQTVASGHGKVFFLNQPYLGLASGYYRVQDTEDTPYLQHIRTPDEMSLIDKRRMPKQVVVTTGDEAWVMRNVDWDERKSGTVETNPGPSIFHDGEGNAVQREITAISYYRGRLFLASEDILVSSVLNNFDDFFIQSPESLTVSDPIDLRVSSNAYTPITYLQPFRNFLFLATDGSTQYELLGSENQISPLTAEIAPTSFYSMAKDVKPVLLNNSLFFLDQKKLYIYFGERSDSTQNSMDISVNCPEYLPVNYRSIAVSPVTGTIFVVDKDNPSHIYCYTNRISGEEILQNSFYRIKLQDGMSIKSLEAVDDNLYIIWEQTLEDWTSVNIGYIDLRNEDLLEPRMDNLRLCTPSEASGTLVAGGTTVFKIKYPTTDINRLMFWDPDTTPVSSSASGLLYSGAATVVGMDEDDVAAGYISVAIVGDISTNLASKSFYLGKTYTTTIELSPIYLRDTNQNARNGYLNLRNGQFRFRNSGDFTISVVRKERAADSYVFAIDVADMRVAELSYKPYQETGIFKAPILGYSHDIDITITSDSIYPLAISDIAFTAKYKNKLADLGSM